MRVHPGNNQFLRTILSPPLISRPEIIINQTTSYPGQLTHTDLLPHSNSFSKAHVKNMYMGLGSVEPLSVPLPNVVTMNKSFCISQLLISLTDGYWGQVTKPRLLGQFFALKTCYRCYFNISDPIFQFILKK